MIVPDVNYLCNKEEETVNVPRSAVSEGRGDCATGDERRFAVFPLFFCVFFLGAPSRVMAPSTRLPLLLLSALTDVVAVLMSDVER